MMKKILVLLGIAALCAGLLLYSFTGAQPQEDSPATVPTTIPTTDPEPTKPPQAGQVLFVNEDPELQKGWETIAAEFSQQSGLTVTVAQSDSGTSDATLFTLTDNDDMTQWAGKCLDLSGTEIYAQLASWDLVLQNEGKICGIPLDVDCFGLVYNAALLAQAGYTNADINSFEDLQTVARSITTNSDELGFSAFAVPDLSGDFAGHFANLTGDRRAFLDLYINNTTQTAAALDGVREADSLNDLLDGKAVFCPAGTDEFGSLAALGEHQLGFLPLYTGGENEENGILHVQVHRYFCIRADAPQQDIDAALAFLRFLVHPREDGTVPIDDLGLFAPYRQAVYATNKLETVFRQELASGRACLNCQSPTAPEGLMQALMTYAAAPTDENWSMILNLL